MKTPVRLLFLLACCACAVVNLRAVCAQSYPNRPIRLIVPFAAGGGTDIAARAMAVRLSEALGQQVVVDNRPGAGTVIGTELAARSAPDGYTLVQCSTSLAITPSLRSKMPYDAMRDFATITQVVFEAYLLITQPTSPLQSVKDLLNVAKQKPGQLTFGSPGPGTGGHFAGELFKLLSGTDLIHVPYKGNGPALTDLLGGQINLLFATILPSLPHVKSGKLHLIAVSTKRRSSLLPDVPTIAEGGVPDYESGSWNGLLVPAGTPKEIVNRLYKESVGILHRPDVRERFIRDGAEPIGNTPEEFTAFIKAETVKWAKVVKAAGIRVE